MQSIADALSKTYRTYRKQEGLVGALKGLFTRQYDEIPAAKNVSFQIEEGEFVGFLGPNGAGKTTVLKMLAGLLVPTSGTARVLDYIPWERKAPFKRQFSLVLGQKNSLWWDLPARESLELNRAIYEIDEVKFRRMVDELVDLLDVRDKLNVMVRELSLGERMKMELIAALIHATKGLVSGRANHRPGRGEPEKSSRLFAALQRRKSNFNDPDQSLHAGYRRTLQTGHHH